MEGRCLVAIIVGVDVGGTFTDLICVGTETGETRVTKVMSTPDNQAKGFLYGLKDLDVPLPNIDLIIHGTTVATNAVLERKGAKTGLLTTQGLRDSLELRRRDRPSTYGLGGNFEPLVPRERRAEVTERVDYRGRVQVPLEDASVKAASQAIVDLEAEAIAVCLMHSYANPEHERRVKAILEQCWPDLYVSISSDLISEYGEFERASTSVVNAFVQPVVSRYLRKLQSELSQAGFAGDVLLIQSNGGIMSLDNATRYPVNTILSGPAAGVVAAAQTGLASDYRDLVVCDMGGTSLDVSLVVDGTPTLTNEKSIEFGLPVRGSTLDIDTVGAGGGSIAWIDRAGILNIGPQSAGAKPGPACYDMGGDEPTLTDANLIMGYIDPDHAIGRRQGLRLNPERASEVLTKRVGDPLKLGAVEAANAVLEVASEKIANSVRKVLVERGHDPRDFSLVMFGGAGPLHAAALMEVLGIRRAIIPTYPGITSAIGCTISDVRHDFVQTVNQPLKAVPESEIHESLALQRQQAESTLTKERKFVGDIDLIHTADLSYEHQFHALPTALSSDHPTYEDTIGSFEDNYRNHYFTEPLDRPIQLVNLRTTIVGRRPPLNLRSAAAGEPTEVESREVYFGLDRVSCPVYQRSSIREGHVYNGPAIIQQDDTTILVRPSMHFSQDHAGNLIIER